MDQQLIQLVEYVSKCVNQGTPQATIQNQLIQAGWSQAYIDAAFRQLNLQHVNNIVNQSGYPPINQAALPIHSYPHKNRTGVLWILSPFIVLIGAIIINLLLRRAGFSSSVTNIFIALAGIVGVLLLPLGPIIGIIKLTRH